MKIRLSIMALLMLSASMACALGFDFGFGFSGPRCVQEDKIPIAYSNYTSFVFGNTTTGQSRWLAGTYTNTGRGYISAVQASMSSATGGFRLYSSTCVNATLTANQSCNYKTEFAPVVEGAASNVVKITSNQFDDLRIPAMGVGIVGSINAVSDDFNRADGALGDNWVKPAAVTYAMAISTNTAGPSSESGTNAAYWVGTDLTDNHCSKVQMLGAINATQGPIVRVSSTDNSYYYFNPTAGGILYKRVLGSDTQIATALGVPSPNDTVKLCASGTTITAYINDALIGTVTDAALSTGYAGMRVRYNASKVDNWEGSSN